VLALAGTTAVTRGTDLIAAERTRQISEEGYGAEHDHGHAEELATAGAAYALAGTVIQAREHPPYWPWSQQFWKPTPDDRLRELVKAGALIAAAIDSLLDEQHWVEV
jgi:hypothetical protein